MLQRPKNNPSGLNDANHKQLVSELTKYAEEGASDEELQEFKNAFISQKKKSVSVSTSEKVPSVQKSQPKVTTISSDTEETQPPVESDGLGGPPKSFPKRDSNIKSVMYGDGMEQPNVLVQSLPLDEKPKKYYRLVSEQKKEVDKRIAELEDRNARLGRRPEDLAREGTYQSLIQNKQQLDSEFKPAELAISEIKKGTPTWTRPIERIVSSATDGKYSLANTETIKLNNEVEDKLIDSFDDAPEEIKQKWYKGSLPTEQKEKIINNAKVDVLNNTFKSLKQETSEYLKNIKDNPNIPDDEKSTIRTNLVNRSNAFNAQVALDFSGNLLKNNFKATDEDKNLDEAIFSKYEGFIPETADMLSRGLEGVISVGGKALTGISTLALLGAEQFNQFTGASKSEDYTPIEATIDLINDTTNYNFLPSSKSEKGAIVGEDGEYNWSYRSITRTLADTLPFTLKIMSDVKKGRVEGSPQSMISQLVNPSKNKAFTDRLNIVETAYKVTINDNYKDAKEIGMDDSKAFTYANVLSLAEGVSETIMPDYKYFDSLTGSTLKNLFKSNLKEAATKQAVKNVTKDFFKSAALELGEEEFVLAVEDGLKYSLLLNHKNSEFFNIKRQKELVAATVIMSGAMGAVAAPGKFKQNRTDIYREVYNNISDIQDTFINEINSPLNDQKAKESLITAYKFANDISNAIANAPETVTADQVDLLVQKKKLEEKKKNIDTAFHPDINEEIAGIDAKIRELSKQPIAAEEVVTEENKEYLGTPTISTIEDGDLYEFKTQDGIIGGVMISPTEFRIDGISANEVGKGQGSKMFEALIENLKTKGVTTLTTKSAGEGAVKMHNKAIDKGLLTKVKEDGRTATFLINSEIKIPSTEEVVAPTEEVIAPTQEVVSVDEIEKRRVDTESKIKRKDLFTGVGDFSTKLGGSDTSAVPFSHKENNGIELVEYAHPKTGSVDVIVTGKSENDFVGFYRIYENGKPTNKWSSKFNNESRNKDDFKTMISGVQEMLPEGHEYTEKASISTDGLRVWNQQLGKGYELQYEENGNVKTNSVAINGDSIVNDLGIDVNKGDFENIKVTNNKDFNTVKNALLPYLEKFGLNESNIRNINGTVKIDLPVLRQSKAKTTEAKPTTEVISPENSSNYANLTEDKEGNFVFFHVGGKGYETIKKSTGGTLATSKEEGGALSKVGGVAMYYTKPSDTERMVNGEAKYAVAIPKEKVYDANTDPNNYAEEAKTRHDEENPGKVFDANSKLAYMTKIAGENGFDMVVSEWMGRTRAQTTTEFAPKDVQLKEGDRISKPFEEEYVENTKKGYKSMIPESKEAKLKAVYNEINTIRGRAQKYDSLYRLSGEDLTNTPQEDITKLVEESDLPQEVKDKYAEAVAYKPGKRYTEAPVETQISAHKKNGGSTFLVNGENKAGSDASSVSIFTERSKIIDGEITEEDINNFKEVNKDLFKGNEDILAIGTWYDSDSKKTYIDVSAVMPHKQAEQLGKQYNQKAVYNLKTNEEVDTGGTGEVIEGMKSEADRVTDIREILKPKSAVAKSKLEEDVTNEPTNNIEAFRDKVKDIPESGKVSKYLSGETIERVEGEAPRNIQEIDVMPLVEAGMHGKETVAMAKEVYGDKYIEKTLEFLDTANLKAHEKALLYVSLENEMFDLVKTDPSLKKLQDLVRAKSQQFLRESSLAINMGRLRAIMKDGFNYESITDKFLSSDQLIGKKEIEKAIQSNADDIQKEYESIVSESDVEQLILSGVEKQINEIYKKLPTARRVRADKAIAALENIQKKLRGRAYDATVGLPIALIDSGITVIKNSIKAGVNIADAIELGINHIKEKYGKDWANESMFRDDMTQGFKTEGISEKEIKANELSNKDIVNQALVEAGFGKEITVKTKDGKVKRNVLDWKKLAGEEGSIDKIRENVEKIIGKEAAKELENEYNDLRASIIEKSLNELERRNTPRKKVNLKTSAKKLAELYNYGLFEKESDTYDRLMNTALGMNELDQKSFNEAKNLAKSLSELFSQKDSKGNQLDQVYLKQAERTINKQIERLLSKVAWSESNGTYKAVVIAKEFIGLAQRNALVSVAQAIENTTSGYISRVFKKIGFMFDNVDTKSLKESRNKLARMTFKDITLGSGLEFGDVTSPFITKSKTMDLIVNASDSRLYHALTSTALGKPFLESADSMHKAALAQGFFQYNLIKILRKKGYSKSEAKNYVSEQLTGQSFEDALVTAKQIIDKINQNAGKKVIPDSKESIYRFANDLVNEALVKGNKITLDELEASLKSAETVAGFELGHEPNNIISKPLNLFNSWVQTRTDRAVKDKKWNDAAALTAASIVTTNILNPYVGGGTNWTLLAAQKAGIPTLSTIYWNIKSRGSKLDLSTEEGMKNLEKDLKYQLLAKNANTRMFIGAAVTLAAFALASATGVDDDLYDWLKKNPWANKYMKKTNPPAVQFMLAQKDKKLGEFLGQQMNIKADAFDEGKKIQQAMKNAASGKTQKALGGAGQLIGSRLSTPIIPWRVVRDVRDIYRGLNGLPEVKHEYKASGFGSGYFQGGMVEQLGLRPEDVKDASGGRASSGSRSDSGSRASSGSRSQSGSR